MTKKIDGFFNRYATLILSIITAGYIIFFSLVSICRYQAFDFHDFDLAIYSQLVRNIMHGSIYSSILGVPFLGNHMDFILFLLAPICILFSIPQALLVIQTIFIGLGAIPVYLIAKDILDKMFAITFVLLYLIYPAVHFVNIFEFHPVALVIPFFLFMFYFYERKRFLPFLSFMLLALFCKENISMGIFFFGLYILIFAKRPVKWWLSPLILSIFWFILTLTLMPHLNKETIGFTAIYAHLGRNFPEIVWNIIRHPGFALKFIFTLQNMAFLLKLFAPVAFIAILSPKTLFIALPFFLQQLLSLRLEDHTIEYHYTAKLIPFVFIAAIYGTQRLFKAGLIKRYPLIFIGALIISSLISNIFFGFIVKKMPKKISDYRLQDIDYEKKTFIKEIPKDAAVTTTFEFLPKLSRRKGLYSFHHVYIGTYTLSNKKYILPQDVEYALIDFDDYLTFTSFYHPDQHRNINYFLAKSNWGLVKARDNIALFKKTYKNASYLYKPLKEFTPTSSKRLRIENSIVMLEYNIDNRKFKPGEPIHLSFIWHCLKEVDKDYWVAIKLVDKNEKILHEYNHPICYRIYPTFAWKQGDIFQENNWIVLPTNIKEREGYIKIGIFERNTLKGAYTEASDAGMFDSKGWVNLGKIIIDHKNISP